MKSRVTGMSRSGSSEAVKETSSWESPATLPVTTLTAPLIVLLVLFLLGGGGWGRESFQSF
jgi:hypothetical protein